MTRAAFTLIEVMLAVALLALLTTAAALTFAEPLRRARASEAVDQLRSFDADARHYARRFGRPVRMEFDLSAGTLSRREEAGARLGQQIVLRGCAIDRLRTPGGEAFGGSVTIPCSALGVSRTYAVHLVGAGADSWLLVSGLTGEVTRVTNDVEIDRAFRAITTRE